VTADASRSTDTDRTGIVSYEFNFGDGSAHTWGVTTTSHCYSNGGPYVITVTVTDAAGLRSQASVSIDVTPPVNPASC
jgi:PKD repeat protein